MDTCVLRIERLKSLCTGDEDFGELYSTYLKYPKEEFLIQDGHLFKGTRICIPKSGICELLIREVHGGSLTGHFGENRTLIMLREYYYWLRISKDMQLVRWLRVICYPMPIHATTNSNYGMGGCKHGFYLRLTKYSIQ